MPLASNLHEFLRGRVDRAQIDRPSARCIAQAALRRWLLPRAARRPDYLAFKKEDLLPLLLPPQS
jgi:hypothetical protein